MKFIWLLIFVGAATFIFRRAKRLQHTTPQRRSGPRGNKSAWSSFLSEAEGHPASVLYDTRYRAEGGSKEAGSEGARPEGATTLYMATYAMTHPDAHGMGDQTEGDNGGQLEDRLAERLSEIQLVLAGHLRSQSLWHAFFYGPPGLEEEFQRTVQFVGNDFGREGRAKCELDPKWSTYQDLLVPSPANERWISDSLVVDSLLENGDSLSTPRMVDYTCVFPSKGAAAEFALEAKDMGFGARVLPSAEAGPAEGTETGFWVELQRKDPVELDHIHGISIQLLELAGTHGGSYDGWGCNIQSGSR